MSPNLYEAYKQWSTRPHDERFSSLEDLQSFCLEKRLHSSEFVQPINQINVKPNELGELVLNGSYEPLTLTNWSFGQLARVAQAPAHYLRTLPAEMSAENLKYSLSKISTDSKMLIYHDPQTNRNFANAFTSKTYGRIWDHTIIEELAKLTEDNSWINPLDSHAKPSGLYASDRDMFAFMINTDNKVEIGKNSFNKGFFLWNSEVGSKTFGFTTFLYNSMCANHIVWGADLVNDLKIYHRQKAFNRFYTDALPIINDFVDTNYISNNIKESVEAAMETKIGNEYSEIETWFKIKDFTKNELSTSYDIAIKTGENPTTLWGMVQGMTSYAKEIPYIDKRVDLERRAGSLLRI